MGIRGLAWLLAALAWLPLAAPAPAAAPAAGNAPSRTLPFDPDHSHVGFDLRTRWGQRLRGDFPAHEGEVRVFGDDRRQVRVRLDSTQVRIVGHARYTRWARGPEFFDVAAHPAVTFVSEHYDAALLLAGGPLHGTLTMRGIAQPVRFELAPSTCDTPGVGCDVVATGTVSRSAFGMDGWTLAVGDAVRFELRVRTRPGAGE